MRHLLYAAFAASILILPAVSFAAQADGPRALERVAQQNNDYEKNHSQQSINVSREHKAAPSSGGDNSAYGFTSNEASRESGARRIAPAQNQLLYLHH